MLKLTKGQKESLIILVFVLAVGFLFYVGSNLTGQVVESCEEVEVCENVTIENCTDNCFEVCENVTVENCIAENVTECEEVCEEINNETVCEEVCEDVVVENCTFENVTECNEVCEDQNCTEVIVENCTTQLICEEINVSNETNVSQEEETAEEASDDEEVVSEIEEPVEEGIVREINETNLTLSGFEENSVRLKTGEDSVLISKSNIVGTKLVLRFEIGDYWMEKSYDVNIDSNSLDLLIEEDRIKFLKKIASNQREISAEEREEFLGEYEI